MTRKGRSTGGRKKRGSPAKKTVDKADVAEVNTVSNKLDLKPIEIDDGDFDMHYKAMKGAKEKFDQSKRLYDGCCKAAKKVSDELLDSVKRAMKFDGMDQDAIKRLLEIDGYVLRKTNSAIQLTLHNVLMGDAVQTAYQRGFDAGLAGDGNANRYPVGSDLAERYDIGWGEGQKKLVANGQPAEGTNSGEPLPLH